MSASRMDKYKSCHFSYFMQYGLKAEPWRVAGFQAPEYGHLCPLRAGARSAGPGAGGVKGGRQEEPQGATWPRRLDRYVSQELGGWSTRPPVPVPVPAAAEIGTAVVDNVAEEWPPQFKPISFELGFGGGEGPAPVELGRRGRDRQHHWLCGPGGRLGKTGGSTCGWWTTRRAQNLDPTISGTARASDAAVPLHPGASGEALYNGEIIPSGVLGPARPGRGGGGQPGHERGRAPEKGGRRAEAARHCAGSRRCSPPWRSRGRRASASCP